MDKRILTLVIVGIVFMLALASISAVIVNKYTPTISSVSNTVKTEPQNPEEEGSMDSSSIAPPQVESARDQINEQIWLGDEITKSVNSSDEYVMNMLDSVEYNKQQLLFPLPYEFMKPLNSQEMIPTVLYRTESNLSRFQEDELMRVKKARLDNYRSALTELQRRVSNPDRDIAGEAYLNDLAKHYDFYVPNIVVGNACGGNNTLGCYYHSNEIEITPTALKANGGYDECLLLQVIAHEARHYQYFQENPIGDYVLQELEDDANEFMRNHNPRKCVSTVYN